MDDREPYGRLVRETWVAWALEQPDPKGSWLVPWDELGAGDREVDMRIGSAVAARAVADAGGEAAAETPGELAALGGGEASVPLRTSEQWAVAWGNEDATKARVEHYDDEEDAAERLGLYGDGAYVVSREVRWGPWRRALAAGAGQEPLSATCTGPGCGEQFADSETSEYLFATRERMQRLLYADGWASDPVLCPACQQEAGHDPLA